jgi:hypothetical protein
VFDWTPIIVAAIGAAGLVLAGFVQVLGQRKTRKTVEAVHDEVRTNHGKSASDYLEMVEEVKDKLTQVEANQNAFVRLLADHTTQDGRQFQEIHDMLTEGTFTP